MKTNVLETDRLVLRPLTANDAETYAAMRYHPKVAKWLTTAPGDPLEAAQASIERYAGFWRDRGYGPAGMFHEGKLIGHVGLNFVPEFGETEVLWAMHPDAWGRGFVTEAARACVAWGFDTLGLQLIFAMTMPTNTPSQAVMKRLGFAYRKDVVYRGVDAVWFDIDRDGWRRKNDQ